MAPDATNLFPPRSPLDPSELAYGLKSAFEAQRQGVRNGKRPFAAVLIAPDRQTVLLRQFSLSHFEHAESELCRAAASQFKPEFLWRCTLFSTWEPCSMCASTQYWAHIGTLVYAASERALHVVIGPGNAENLTLDLPCRDIFAKGQKDVRVVGPVNGGKSGEGVMVNWETKVCEDAWTGYWHDQRGLSGTGWAEYAKGKI